MYKYGCLLLSLALSLGASGQVATPSGGLRTSCEKVEKQVAPAPQRAELNANQRLTGYYTSDNLAKSGMGIPQYGENDHCKAGIELTAEMLRPFVGKNIVGVRFGLCAKMDKSRVFVSQDSSGVIGEDVLSKDVATPVKGWNSVLFDAPYTIEEGQSFLVGFEFAQKTKKKGGYYSDVCYPLSVVKEGLKNRPVMLFYQGESGEGWYNVENTGDNLSIQLIVEGDFKDYGAMPFGFGTVAAELDKASSATVQLLNMGLDSLRALSYTLTVDGVKGEEQTCALAAPVAANELGTFDITLPAVSTYGRKRVVVDVTKVDGRENQAETRAANGYVGIAQDFFPRNVLIEEFTTENCSNCPRVAGYLHKMLKDVDEERVFAVSHHSAFYTDWLTQPCDVDIYSLMFGGSGDSFAPAMMLNRNSSILQDTPSRQGNVFIPSSHAEIAYYANQLMEEQANSQLEIEVAPSADGTQATVIVKGRCNEAFEMDKSRLTLYLTEDSIAAKNQEGADGPFYHMHVIRYYNASWGDKVVWNDDATFTATYTLDVGWDWDKKQLKCVAFLSKLNDADFSDNKIDNSACVEYLKAATQVAGVSDGATVTETARYTVNGLRASSVAKGIQLVKLSDGRVVKMVVR